MTSPTGTGMTSQRTRDRLVTRLRDMGIRDEQVLDAIGTVPRHLFVEEALASRAYEDTALPIGYGQTISQPYIVALMTQALFAGAQPARVLEVGSGSGYQTAVLAALADKVYSVERIETLLHAAQRRLVTLGYRNVRYKVADGNAGWPAFAPYDGIIVTAAAANVPHTLVAQLAPDGRMVVPVGHTDVQDLLLVRRTDSGFSRTLLERVNFVPLVTG